MTKFCAHLLWQLVWVGRWWENAGLWLVFEVPRWALVNIKVKVPVLVILPVTHTVDEAIVHHMRHICRNKQQTRAEQVKHNQGSKVNESLVHTTAVAVKTLQAVAAFLS